MTSPDRRKMITVPVDLGVAELVPDPRSANAWALFIDGVAQSYVDLDDPLYLEFAYARRVAGVIDAVRSPGVPIDVLHLGGGALSLPRYVAATRPGSRQLVVERDSALYEFVLQRLPMPADVDVTVLIGGARPAMASAASEAYDLIISDVFEAARMPSDVATAEFAELVVPALRPDGLYVVNVTDMPSLAFTRRLAATLRTAFAQVCVLADPGMLRGRRFGNCLVVASRQVDGVPTRALVRSRPRDSGAVGLLRGEALDEFIAGAAPLRDDTVASSRTGVHTVRRLVGDGSGAASGDVDVERSTEAPGPG
jgi:hypothetical protein